MQEERKNVGSLEYWTDWGNERKWIKGRCRAEWMEKGRGEKVKEEKQWRLERGRDEWKKKSRLNRLKKWSNTKKSENR